MARLFIHVGDLPDQKEVDECPLCCQVASRYDEDTRLHSHFCNIWGSQVFWTSGSSPRLQATHSEGQDHEGSAASGSSRVRRLFGLSS